SLTWFSSAFLFTSLALAGTKVSVWPVDSLVKVFPDDPAGKNRASDEACLIARNGHASVQLAVRSEAPVDALDVTVKLGGGLKTLVRHAGYVPVRANPPGSPADEVAHAAPARFPDPLFEDSPFRLPANETMATWITIYAPAGTAPGVYKGEAVFKSGRLRLASVPFRVQVTHAAVPARQTLKVTNWFTLTESELGRYYDLTGNPGRYWEVLGNIARVVADHRQNVMLTPVLELTDARVNGESLSYDFSRLDRFIETFRKTGAAEIIEGGHLMGRASGYDTPLKIPAFVVENGTVREQQLDPDDPRAEAHFNSFLPALYSHLKEKGWLDRYVQHVLDEAHGSEPPVYLRYVKLVRKALPGVPTIDAIDQTAGLLGEACDIWVPQLGKFDDGFDAIREHVSKGGQAWFYTCLYPQGRYLNRFIDYPLVKTRLLHWFNFRYDFTGFLHWGGNYWAADPYGNVEPAIEDGKEVLPAGDAFITYPWREKDSIHSSIRLEAMREGIEDYELLRALSAKDPEKARQIARQAIPGLTDYVRDVAAFRRLQAELLAE
ncbi:MAG TPA: DUF4091 domain-containing protein, partial [Bryobacteraceae bacterium]|nr:DUF4091 domain-containing protein [Bryobacteraceae bacterium]